MNYIHFANIKVDVLVHWRSVINFLSRAVACSQVAVVSHVDERVPARNLESSKAVSERSSTNHLFLSELYGKLHVMKIPFMSNWENFVMANQSRVRFPLLIHF